MPLTAEQSYALGTSSGRDRINQQLRANPQYMAFLQSIGVNTSGPLHLSDQQRKMAADWVRRNLHDIGGLEVDPSGNLNNPRGFGEELKQWGPVAAAGAGIAAPFALPALGFGGGGGAAAAPAASGSVTEGLMSAVPASISSQGVSAGMGAAGASGAGAAGTAAAAGGGGLASNLAGAGKNALSQLATPAGAASLAALIAGLSGNNQSAQSTDEIRRIQAITEARMRRADPLHQVATNLAFGRLPVNYRQGVQLNNVPLPG